ncbi:hypothetical protein BJ742DRAFT_739209 [Cladochytrium replicatum]|nr:hypothetical protein BJ742DRAFT_739209 [Cladochytrium replicatum]
MSNILLLVLEVAPVLRTAQMSNFVFLQLLERVTVQHYPIENLKRHSVIWLTLAGLKLVGQSGHLTAPAAVEEKKSSQHGPPSLMLKPAEIWHAMLEMDKMHGTSFLQMDTKR